MTRPVAGLMVLLALAVSQDTSPLTEFSCQPLADDSDYESVPDQLQTTSRATPEECCEDCRKFEAVCDFFTWTPENDGTCELKKLQLPQTKIDRPGAQSSFLAPCQCTKGSSCNNGVCTGCSLFGTCYSYDRLGCTHGGGKMCDGSATTSRVTTRTPSTTKSNATTTSPTPSQSTTSAPATSPSNVPSSTASTPSTTTSADPTDAPNATNSSGPLGSAIETPEVTPASTTQSQESNSTSESTKTTTSSPPKSTASQPC
ncbi:hypothetical protein LEN26_001349 [Aphanomyces euteiches]|nr:hypothetical protein LEN26_001349 [Aphanomyces euteiches]KAH9185056.1 hypothetical protein AeNC1_012971 [Aphanomyces euteiches]